MNCLLIFMKDGPLVLHLPTSVGLGYTQTTVNEHVPGFHGSTLAAGGVCPAKLKWMVCSPRAKRCGSSLGFLVSNLARVI